MESTKPYAGILAQERTRPFESSTALVEARQWRITDTAVPFAEVMRWFSKWRREP
jgi:hypothetical protein